MSCQTLETLCNVHNPAASKIDYHPDSAFGQYTNPDFDDVDSIQIYSIGDNNEKPWVMRSGTFDSAASSLAAVAAAALLAQSPIKPSTAAGGFATKASTPANSKLSQQSQAKFSMDAGHSHSEELDKFLCELWQSCLETVRPYKEQSTRGIRSVLSIALAAFWRKLTVMISSKLNGELQQHELPSIHGDITLIVSLLLLHGLV